jgi:hypothetical protein
LFKRLEGRQQTEPVSAQGVIAGVEIFCTAGEAEPSGPLDRIIDALGFMRVFDGGQTKQSVYHLV